MASLALGIWTGLIIIYLIELFLVASPHHDQTWYLCAAERMLAGARLYGPRIVETNPPLIIWFSALPVFLAHLLHLESIASLKLVVFIMAVGSTAWCVRILRAAGFAASSVLFYLALGSILSAEIYLHGYDLGQREHLLVILILPYILAAVFGDTVKLSFAELCALGIAAGIAVCFKPQQVLILVAFEFFLAAWNRSLQRLTSPAFLCAVLAVLAYIALVFLATPLYFTAMLPLLRDTYWAYGLFSTWSLIKNAFWFDLLFVLAFVFFISQRRKLRFAGPSGAFLACSLASFIAYLSQHVGAPYQTYPQDAFLLLAILWIAFGLVSPALLATWKFNATYAVSTILVVLSLSPFLIISERGRAQVDLRYEPYAAIVFAHYPPQTPVFIFSTNLVDAFPAVVQDHLVWASRFPCLWMLSAIVQNEQAEAGGPPPAKILPPSVVKRLADLQRTETTEDFQRWKPVVVIVRRCSPSTPCVFLGRLNFDPVPWFLKSPAFAAEWSHYRLQSTHGAFDIYTRVR